MNKQEAIEKIKNIETLNIKDRMDDKGVDMVIKNHVLDIISKIDEPQKVVVPKFVAEWIDTLDEHGLFGLNYDVVDESVWNWVYENYDYNVKKLHLAYLYGYEIEQDKLYTVEIPDPHGVFKIRYLYRCGDGNIRIGGSDYKDIFSTTETHLTEAEIKQDFEWAFQFAKPVEEEEW